MTSLTQIFQHRDWVCAKVSSMGPTPGSTSDSYAARHPHGGASGVYGIPSTLGASRGFWWLAV